MANVVKARYWWGVLYPDGMVENWQSEISDILQLPFAYCVHDKCKDEKGEKRKTHIHLIIAFPNTTTEKHATSIFSSLSAEGQQALADGGHIRKLNSVRYAYEYLIHNTENCRKKNKHQYEPNERITGNNFDIGFYEQISDSDKKQILKDIIDLSRSKHCHNLDELYEVLLNDENINFSVYFDIFVQYQSLLMNMTKSAYIRSHAWNQEKEHITADKTDEKKSKEP